MTDDTPNRGALVVPGGMYGPHVPLLTYAADAAERRGARIRPLTWSRPEGWGDLEPADREPWVASQVGPALDALDAEWPGVTPLLIGKSLGANAAGLAADRNLPAVWLTPDLRSASMRTALARAAAPCLLVGGTADPMWDPAVARKLSPHVYEVADADHGMYVPGPLAASAAVLGQVATAVEGFLDEVVWR